jgi:hypothetical protein
MTAEKVRPVRNYNWTADSKMLLYVQDKGGDENFLLYGVNVTTGEERLLTPFEKTRVGIVGVSNRIHDRILIGLNNRDPRWHDVYSLELATGKLTEIIRGDGYAGFIADNDLKLRVAMRPDGRRISVLPRHQRCRGAATLQRSGSRFTDDQSAGFHRRQRVVLARQPWPATPQRSLPRRS